MQKSQRLISLDIFRGLTIAAMILVNNPGSWACVYAPLEHAEWFGLTPTDLIFPFFLFIVGVAIKLSLDKYLVSSASRRQLLGRIIRRTLLLFALGLVLNFFSDFNLATLRIPGVLQRIAVCYFFAAMLYLAFSKRVDNAVSVAWQPLAITAAALLLLYYLLMTFVPVPGYGPGQIHALQGNLAAWVDRAVFGSHLWSQSRFWDPEGLLSTLPALATTLSGVLTGWWLKSGKSKRTVFYGLLIAGGVGVISGLLASLLMPIGKNLWTPSFVLVTSGLALLVLGLIYYYADVKERTTATKPFLAFGANAITVYILSGLGAVLMWKISFPVGGHLMTMKEFVYQLILQPVFGEYMGSLVFAILYVLLWWGVMSIFYKKEIFIKI